MHDRSEGLRYAFICYVRTHAERVDPMGWFSACCACLRRKKSPVDTLVDDPDAPKDYAWHRERDG